MNMRSPVKPFAAASLVYRAHPVGDRYAGFLDTLWANPAVDVETVLDELQAKRELLLDAGALPGARMRERRMRRMLGELEYTTDLEDLRKFTREIVLPPELLPLAPLRQALARGAADVVFAWLREGHRSGLEVVESRLRQAARSLENLDPASWTADGLRGLALVSEAVHEPPAPEKAAPLEGEEISFRVMLPEGLNPAMMGRQTYKDLILEFSASPGGLTWPTRGEEPESDIENRGRLVPGAWAFVVAIGLSEDLFLLGQAENSTRIAALGVRQKGEQRGAVVILLERGGQWLLWRTADPRFDSLEATMLEALGELGLGAVEVETFTEDSLKHRLTPLLARFDQAAEIVARFRDQRLREVNGHFIEPNVRLEADKPPLRTIEAMNDWLVGPEQTALVLGEFGSGKSTTLAEWASRLWAVSQGPRPVLCNLAGAGASADAEFLLLQSAGLDDTPANRAALGLLIRHRRLLPIFDGFDEMATRLTPGDLGGRLSELLRVASRRGKVVVSSRDHYFPTEERLLTTTQQALEQALGASAGVRRLTLQLFDEKQIAELVGALRGADDSASSALRRISKLYPLQELVRRPLLLSMVVSTLDEFDQDARISKAEVFEKYLARWLEQTRHQGDPEVFSPPQKEALAEALAEQLWRSEKAACSPMELEHTTRAVLLGELPGDVPPDAAILEVFGGSFFVREGADRFRFAHKSFLEFFLARSLVRTLPERPVEALTTRPITQEVAAFVGELLRRDGEPKRSLTYQSLRSWLTVGRRASAATPEAVAQTAPAAANALRLLLGLGRWSSETSGWLPEGADLRKVSLQDLEGASLVAADLSEANLSGADLSGADLSRAILRGVRLSGACLDRAVLTGLEGGHRTGRGTEAAPPVRPGV